MTTEERLTNIEAKLDRLLNAAGLRETLSSQEQHRVEVMSRMSLDDLKAQSKLISLKHRRRKAS